MKSQGTSTEGPAEFTVFPRLPEEVRLMIWTKALPGPRVVELEYHQREKDHEESWVEGHFTSSCSLPVILSACQESRSEAPM